MEANTDANTSGGAVNLVPGIRASLDAKLGRLLRRPIIAQLVERPGAGDGEIDQSTDDLPDSFRSLRRAARELAPERVRPWREDPEDGTCAVQVSFDHDGKWRGCDKEILEAVSSAVEGVVTLLTDAQRELLECSPRKFLALSPPPESVELVGFEKALIGGSRRVVELRLASAPQSTGIRHIAIVPSMVQIERQLAALRELEQADDDGPLGPLRALVGLGDPTLLARTATHLAPDHLPAPAPDERFDPHQLECVHKAMTTPHFAVIEGPPGSGKTTVIAAVIRRALARAERVLVVSPTHVAVDNVVEKLVPSGNSDRPDPLDARSLPVRYSARAGKVSRKALEYWEGANTQRRGATIARRVQTRLSETVPFAKALFRIHDPDAAGHAPLSTALSGAQSVICGTPIGILSFAPVKSAPPASFDMLVVDEVSKMTLPEFLAIAVKARRWVVVGDPAQLPPYNDAEDNAVTLDDVLPPVLDLACSVGAIFERTRPPERHQVKLVVVSSDPPLAARAIDAHLRQVLREEFHRVGLFGETQQAAIVVCARDEVEQAWERVAASSGPESDARILVESGPDVTDSGTGPDGTPSHDPPTSMVFVEPKERAKPTLFENVFNVYHSQPWSTRSSQRLPFLGVRNGIGRYLPSEAALEAIGYARAQAPAQGDARPDAAAERRVLIEAIATRYAINAVSLYDWLTGIPGEQFDRSPLVELAGLGSPALREATRPFVGTLKKQYRMHATLSRVPRELFYFDHALHDGPVDARPPCRAVLVQVDPEGPPVDFNQAEVGAVCKLLQQLDVDSRGTDATRKPGVMVITPYREQEARLTDAIEGLGASLTNLDVDVCTLDRCQGREAEYVLISVVRSRSTPFLDLPRRWNVGLTRAREGLFILGNIDAFRREASDARRDLAGPPRDRGPRTRPGETRPRMSLLARIIEAYDRQAQEHLRPRAQRAMGG